MFMELEGTNLENCLQGGLEKDKQMEHSKLAQNMRRFVCDINAHQRATTAEETFNIQRDNMTPCMDVSQSLSPATPFPVPRACGHGHSSRDADCELIEAVGYTLY